MQRWTFLVACGLVGISPVSRAAPTYEVRIITVPYDPSRPGAPTRVIVPVQVGSAAPPGMPSLPPTRAYAPPPPAASIAAPPAWAPPAVSAPPPPPAPRDLGAPADPTSAELENPFADARESALAAAATLPPVEERHAPAGPIRMPQVEPPAPKACLKAAASGGGGMEIEGVGLTGAQIRSVIDGFAPKTLSCLAPGTRGKFMVQASISVGCDGVVSLVEIAPGSGLPMSVTSCLEFAWGSAPFPANDKAGGVTFEIPIAYGQ